MNSLPTMHHPVSLMENCKLFITNLIKELGIISNEDRERCHHLEYELCEKWSVVINSIWLRSSGKVKSFIQNLIDTKNTHVHTFIAALRELLKCLNKENFMNIKGGKRRKSRKSKKSKKSRKSRKSRKCRK